MAANSNWYNAHNFYGDLTDIEAAKLDEVKKFFSTYYAPNNAALAIVGDFDTAEAKKFVEKYFGPIKAADVPPQPDLTEPRQETEKAHHQDRCAGAASRAGHRLSHAGPQHARVLRHGPDRADAHRRRRRAALQGTGAEARHHRQRGRRHQRAGQHVQLQRPHAAVRRRALRSLDQGRRCV